MTTSGVSDDTGVSIDSVEQAHTFKSELVRGPSGTQYHTRCTCGWSFMGVTWALVEAYMMSHLDRLTPDRVKTP